MIRKSEVRRPKRVKRPNKNDETKKIRKFEILNVLPLTVFFFIILFSGIVLYQLKVDKRIERSLTSQLIGKNIPKTLIPKHIHELGVKVETNLQKALQWCDVANMLRVQNERMEISYFPSTREYTQQYGVTKPMLESLNKEIVII